MSFALLDRMQAPATTETVVISREWHHPQITVTLNKDRITVEASLADFVEGLLAEMKPAPKPQQPGKLARWILGDAQLAQPEDPTPDMIRSAAYSALEKIKGATTQVM